MEFSDLIKHSFCTSKHTIKKIKISEKIFANHILFNFHVEKSYNSQKRNSS